MKIEFFVLYSRHQNYLDKSLDANRERNFKTKQIVFFGTVQLNGLI